MAYKVLKSTRLIFRILWYAVQSQYGGAQMEIFHWEISCSATQTTGSLRYIVLVRRERNVCAALNMCHHSEY